MSSLTIFFTIFITVVTPKNISGSITVQDIDVDKLLNLVNQNRINPQDSGSSDSDNSDDSDTSDDLGRSGQIRNLDNIMDLISLAVNNKNIKLNNNDHINRKPNRGARLQKDENRNNNDEDNSQQTSNVAQMLEQLLNKGNKNTELKWQINNKIQKKRMLPNRLLGDIKPKNPDDLDEYSKIYILLNPEALQKNKAGKSNINKMISKLLSLSSSSSKRDQSAKLKQRRYKGFAIKPDIVRRRGGDSREKFPDQDSVEDVKIQRSPAGHTAIPYIHHRGENIYEKDN